MKTDISTTQGDSIFISDIEINEFCLDFLKKIESCYDTYSDLTMLIDSNCESNSKMLIWDSSKPKLNMSSKTLSRFDKIEFRVPKYLEKYSDLKSNFKLFLIFSKNKTDFSIRFKVEMDFSSQSMSSGIPNDGIDLYYVDVVGINFTIFEKFNLGRFLHSFDTNSSVRDYT